VTHTTGSRTGPHALADALTAAGDYPAAWAAELDAVPREHFIPPRVWVENDEGDYQPVDRETELDRWLNAVYSDRVVVTQFDDGATCWPDVGFRPTCSASMPSAVFGMLDAVDIRSGHRVLEIGAGTGYNAGLLAARLGDDAVTTMEVDTELADTARANLAAAGRHPVVVAADGAAGVPDAAPFDRIIVTAAVQLGRLPYSWVEQTASGGVILAPIRTDLTSGPLVRFDVHEDRTATGAPVPMRVGFMELRSHRNPLPVWAELRWDDQDAEISETEIEPWSLLHKEPSRWAVGVAVPACRYAVWKRTPERDHGVAWLVDPLSRSWATVVPAGRGRYTVRQHGPRRLWDEAAAAYRWWVNQGKPALDQWRFTIEPTRQTAQLA
jgi:protein-L-isoaspartate O-methyltransferase